MAKERGYIDEIMDTGEGTPADGGQEQENDGDEAQTTTEDVPVEGEGGESDAAEPDAGEGDQSDKQPEPTRGREAREDGAKPPKQAKGDRTPKPGDLLGPNGQVIARAGMERRIYERAFNDARGRITPIFDKMNREVEALRGQVAAHQEYNTTARELQLNPTEQVLGLKLIAAYRKEPQATLNYLLTEAKANGHNVTLGNQPGIDASAISSMIDKKLEPFTTQHREQEQFNEAKAKATEDYNEFMSSNPGARVHENEIAELLQRFPHLSLESAYLRLENWMLQNGYDASQPLPPQVAAQNAPRQRPSNVRGQRPLTNGRTPPGLAGVEDAAQGALASVDENYGEIVRRVMRHLVAN
jgi:hypothetical protein